MKQTGLENKMDREDKELAILKEFDARSIEKGILVNVLYLETVKAKLLMLDKA